MGRAQAPRLPPVWNVPQRRNPHFTGRDALLEELHAKLTNGRVAMTAVHGLGGIGKTQLALEYTYRHVSEFDLVWWLRAEGPATLLADYAALAGELRLPEATERELAAVARAVRRTLERRDRWLLVLDNASEPKDLEELLPRGGGGRVLITSRRTDWHGFAETFPFEVMHEAEALQLLTGRHDPEALPSTEFAEAKGLARELGYLPLALAQARAYMAETGKSFAGYHNLLRASRPAMLDKGWPGPNYPASVGKTWQLSIEAAAGVHPAARPLLELLAFFAPEALPLEVLASAPAALPEGLNDEFERDMAIAALHRFSLIGAGAGAITVHRLVQAVTRDGLDGATAEARAAAAVRLVSAALPDPPWEHTHWPAIGALLPHALAAGEAAERLGTALEDAGTVLKDTALYHKARAAYAEAEPLYRRALAIGERTLGPEHPDVVISLNGLTNLYRTTGRLAEAEPLLKRALVIDEKALGPEHPDLAIRLGNLAGLYHETGRLAEAEPLYRRALAIDEKALGPEHPSVAIRLNNLALLYQDTGRLAEAEPLYRRALAIIEKTLPADHPYQALYRENYANLFDVLGRPAEAAELRARADAIRRRRG